MEKMKTTLRLEELDGNIKAPLINRTFTDVSSHLKNKQQSKALEQLQKIIKYVGKAFEFFFLIQI